MKRYIVIIAALAVCAVSVRSQYNEANNLYYHAFRMPQSNMLNAAFFPNKARVYLQLPEIGVRFGSPLALQDVMRNQGDTMTVIDLQTMMNALSEDSRFRVGAEANALGFGFKIRHTFFTFNTRVVSSIDLGLPINAIQALLHGNVDENGQAINEITFVDGSLLNAQAYAEASIGAGHYFESIGLTVGAHAKLLYGIANLQTDNTHAELITDDDFDRIKLKVYYQLQMASAVPIDSNGVKMPGVGELLDIFHANTGLAFDIGAKYDVGPFSFSFAINDLSAGIHWRKNVYSYTPQGGYIESEYFSGLDASEFLHAGNISTDSITSYWQSIIDDLEPAKDSTGDYWYGIPTKINLGASYSFAKMFRAGLLFHGQFDRGLLSKGNTYELDLGEDITNTFRFNTTLSVGANLFNWMEVTLGSSIVYDGSRMSFFNPGASIVLAPATAVQVFLTADYISSVYLAKAKAFNLRFGLNVLLGRGSKISQN